MEKRQRLILVHILQSLAITISAGVIVAVLQWLLSDEFSALADGLASLGQYWIGGLIIFVLACFGISFPNGFVSTVRSLKWLLKCPPVHFGILAKVVIGAVVYLLLILTNPSTTLTLDAYSIGLLGGFCSLGLIAGHILACLVKKLQRHAKTALSQKTKKQGLDAWLADDQPIQSESESLFAEHSSVAKRILNKLLTEPKPESHILTSVALIGPYGSGKTSICNLVEDVYRKDKEKLSLPELLFCRFEGWQFMSAEAAVKNLIDVAAREVFRLVDFPELWRIPQKYVEAIKASGSWWSSVCAVLFGGSDNPEEIASIIGDALVRLNVRLVIFVDDFDRIEEDAFATQQAVAKALNQLQNLPNTQYVISVGPTIDIGRKSGIIKRSWDLLKLTRFQELVPKINPEKVISLIRKHRDDVLNDSSCYFPWAERSEGESDPLDYYPQFRRLFSSLGFRGRLLGLVQTPRALKSMLRESNNAWEGGLKGEIDWYDLILANALKAAEPAVFEWIARDRDVFIEEPRENLLRSTSQQNERYSKELNQQLEKRIESKEPTHYEIVKDVVCELFPSFEAKIKGRKQKFKPIHQWSQKISLRPNHGADYIERFFAGEVPDGDVPDQPTLQYIRKVIAGSFDSSEFESLYLCSHEKLTGVLNTLVQFAGLISRQMGYTICDAMLAWIARSENDKYLWPDSGEYIYVMGDVTSIIRFSGMKERLRVTPGSGEQEKEDWFIQKIEQYTGDAPFVAIELLEYGSSDSLISDEHEKRLGELLQREFVQGNRQFLPVLRASRYSLARLIDRIQRFTEYERVKTKLTQKLITEAENDEMHVLKERIIISLVNITLPGRSGEIPIESYGFSIDKAGNERNYDMSLMISALIKWHAISFSDKVAEKAFSHFARAYDLNRDGIG